MSTGCPAADTPFHNKNAETAENIPTGGTHRASRLAGTLRKGGRQRMRPRSRAGDRVGGRDRTGTGARTPSGRGRAGRQKQDSLP